MQNYYNWLSESRSSATAQDADFKEEDHPRNTKGGTGGGRFRTSGKTIEKEDEHSTEKTSSNWWPEKTDAEEFDIDSSYGQKDIVRRLGRESFGDWRDELIRDAIQKYGYYAVGGAIPSEDDPSEFARTLRSGGYLVNTANGMVPTSMFGPPPTREEIEPWFFDRCARLSKGLKQSREERKQELKDAERAKKDLSEGASVSVKNWGRGEIVGSNEEGTQYYVKFPLGGDWFYFKDIKKE